MPRKQVRGSEHDRRKPHQEEKTHVDHYVREQETSARSPVSAQELGSMDEQINEKVDAGWKQRGMKLLTQADRKKLPKLYSTEKTRVEDHVLQVKFFTPTSNCTWYAVEFDGDDTFFGYVEGFENEWGYFSFRELSEVKGPMGVGVERDKYWKPTKFGNYIAQKS